MTVPPDLQYASEDFERLLRDVVDLSGLTTRNQAYTTLQGVLQTFRRRLTLRQGIQFANALPPVLRALFLVDWDLDQPVAPFLDRATMTREAQALRRDHNFSPDTCIRDVAAALRRNVDQRAFDRVLADLPVGAPDFWR